MPTQAQSQQYNRGQFAKLLKNLPDELQDALFSAATTENIVNACRRNELSSNLTPRVSDEVGKVLMGITLPKDFQQALQKQVGLKPAVAQNIAQEINRLVFYPVKAQLEEIHQAPGQEANQTPDIGVATPRHAGQEGGTGARTSQKKAPETDYLATEEPEQPEEPQEEPEEIVEEPKPKQTDPYRESVE